MSTIAEIENALRALPIGDARTIADWLQDYLDEQWDKQISHDAVNGQLDRVWDKARADISAGKVKPLNEIIDDE